MYDVITSRNGTLYCARFSGQEEALNYARATRLSRRGTVLLVTAVDGHVSWAGELITGILAETA